tara:strand:- start:224 stop:352 length:129 start_codon:yes stop_codon:yes gene_type:complete
LKNKKTIKYAEPNTIKNKVIVKNIERAIADAGSHISSPARIY